ncbi:MAG TPA: hypothetical protein VHC39_12630 [Rhizomicrobium sp.]|nr:hypothetical protein [Rhizomicrobium sp.]
MAKRKKIDPAVPSHDSPEFTAETMARAKRVEDIPALAHLSKRKPGQRGRKTALKS